MANDCLVKKLKGSVQNDNLPILGKLIIKLEQISDATDSQKWCWLKAEKKACEVQFVNTVFSNASHVVQPTTLTIPAGGVINGHLDLSNPNAYLVVDAYSITHIQIPSVKEFIGFESCNYAPVVGILLHYGNASSVLSPLTNIKALTVTSPAEVVEPSEVLLLLQNNPNLLVIDGAQYKSNNSTIPVTSLQENTQIQFLYLSGNIGDFPTTMKRMFIEASKVTGSVTEWVARCRTAGRTYGKIKAEWLGATNNVTIDDGNGTEIGANTFITAKGYSAQQNMYLVWTENSIDITTDGSGAEEPVNLQTVTVD